MKYVKIYIYIKWIFVVLFLEIISVKEIIAQVPTPDMVVEAENGARSGGVIIANSFAGYSGTGYVTNFKTTADKITVTVNIATKGFYKIIIRYYSDGNKSQNLYINNIGPKSIVFTKTTTFADLDVGKQLLNAGENTITIQSVWGYIHIDKFSLFSVQNKYAIAPDLVNSNADSSTKALYAFLVSKFNVRIISGQTDDWFDNIKPITNKTPMLRAFDFQHYTQGYPYLWDNSIGGHTFGVEDNGQVKKAIDWYNETGKVGIVSFQWHWHSPGGGQVSTNTFYTNSTTFDVTKAIVPGNIEYTKIIEDIDTIAFQLKRLQNAGVPVLWRPLHEAGGGWFWWGAKGPVACRKLYQILFNRITIYHGLNNLIWIWSTPETDWYPGNDSVDIVGHDSYPGNYIYDPQKSAFDKLYQLTGGQKLIAMTENGPIPNPDDCLLFDAPWSYFMSWSDLVTAQNTNQHIIDAFTNINVLTLENPTLIEDIAPQYNSKYKVYPNPAKNIIFIDGYQYSRIELIDLNGRLVFASTKQLQEIEIQHFKSGIYIIRIFYSNKVYQQKIIIHSN